jgi:hypothetical protein
VRASERPTAPCDVCLAVVLAVVPIHEFGTAMSSGGPALRRRVGPSGRGRTAPGVAARRQQTAVRLGQSIELSGIIIH